jgi:hypothetical protein
MLTRHPRVYFPPQKELHFFSSYSDSLKDGRLETTGLASYFSHFAAAGAEQICGEATPSYLFDKGACERIQRVLPSVRLVVILRDPVARAWSHYWHQVRRGREQLGFEEALEAEERRLATEDPRQQARFSYRARGRYIESLRRYESRFSREQLCVVFLEDLRREARPVIEQICAHLGIEEPDASAELTLPHANKADFPKWPRLDALTRTVRRWAEDRGPGLARPVRTIGRVTRSLRVYSGAPRMPEAARQDLRRAFAASDLELGDWLGRPPPWAEALGPEARLW